MKNIIEQIFNKERRISSDIFLYYPFSHFSLSYKELYEQSLKIAVGLKKQGVNRGDRVLVFFDNTPQSVILAFSLMMSGAVLVPVEPSIKSDTLQYIIKNSETKYTITFNDIEELNISPTFLIHYSSLINTSIEDEIINSFYVDPTDIIVILYTSGSTGNPKGIVFTYDSVIENFTEYGNTMKFSKQTRFLQVMPLYHADGWNFTLLVPYLFNCTVVLTPKFNLNVCRDIFQIIRKYECNILVAIPSILDSISLFSQRYKKEDLPKLNFVITSSEKLCNTTKKTFEDLFKCNVYDLYGLTETQIVSYYNENIEWVEGSVGMLQNKVQVQFSEDGELLIKSPYLFKEYCNNIPLTQTVMKNGWFSTGDLAQITADGHLILLGRKNDIINKGGEKISPNEIDTILKGISFVKDSYTLGVNDEVYGQDILTIVVVDDVEKNIDTKNIIKNICLQKLNRNSVPKYIMFIDSFPLNRSGKKDKIKIKDIVKDEYNL